MVMTLERALRMVSHAGYDGLSLEALDIVNEAGSRLVSMHPWNWTMVPPVHAGVRAAISIAAGTWTTATRTLTEVGTFAAYTFAAGDSITITSGTNAVARDYTVQERVSDDAIIVTEDIGADNAAADIVATLNANHAVILPSNFGRPGLVGYRTTEGLTHRVQLIGVQDLVRARTNTAQVPIGNYIGAIFSGEDVSTAGGVPSTRLELWPYPTAVDHDLFTISYHRKWTEVSTDSKIISIHSEFEPLFIALLRAVTKGYEEEEEGAVEDRIDAIKQSSMFFDLASADGLVQPDLGPLANGNEQPYGEYGWPHPTNYVTDPA